MSLFQLLGNLTKFNSGTNGTATFNVASVYGAGYLTPEQNGVADGQTYDYYAQSTDGSQFESGSGIYSVSTHTLTRVTTIFHPTATRARSTLRPRRLWTCSRTAALPSAAPSRPER